MTDQKREPSVKFITPRGVAIFPKLNKPDTKFKKEGQYTARLRIEGLDEELMEKLTALRDEKLEAVIAGIKDKSIFPKANPKERAAKLEAIKTADILTVETDKEGEETGFYIINPKMTASGVSKKDGKPWTRVPKVFDAKNKILKPTPNIYGGSELKIAVEARAYFAPGTKEAPPVVGITFYMDAVQVLKLVQAGDRSAESYGFGEEEGGYEGEQTEEGQFGGDSESSSEGSDSAASDNKDF